MCVYIICFSFSQIAEISFGTGASSKSKISGENDSEHSELPPFSDPETNVYSFGIMLLEIISGKLPNKEEQGPLVNWVQLSLPFSTATPELFSVRSLTFFFFVSP